MMTTSNCPSADRSQRTVLRVITYISMYMLQGNFAFGTFFDAYHPPELVYTILVTLVLYQVILHVNKRLEAEEQRSASKFV